MNNKGFTLIELLIVIAVIGILSSVVVVALTSARNKAGNVSVKTNLYTIRNQAEIYFSNNQDYTNICSDGVVVSAINTAINAGGDTGNVSTRCNGGSTAWAVNVTLRVAEGSNIYWCVDNSGASKGEPSELSGATVCS